MGEKPRCIFVKLARKYRVIVKHPQIPPTIKARIFPITRLGMKPARLVDREEGRLLSLPPSGWVRFLPVEMGRRFSDHTACPNLRRQPVHRSASQGQDSTNAATSSGGLPSH